MPVYVGIDPSISNTGVVVLSERGSLLAAFDGKQAYRGKIAYDIARYLAQAEFIAAKLKDYDISGIAYEDYSFGSIHRGMSLAEYGGILKAALYRLWPSVITLVAPCTNKKFATGCGQAGKERMANQALLECPELGQDASQDIFDAYFLAKYALYSHCRENAHALDRKHPLLRKRLELTMEEKQ